MRGEWRPPTRKTGKGLRIEDAETIVGSLGEYVCVCVCKRKREGIGLVVVWRGYDGML